MNAARLLRRAGVIAILAVALLGTTPAGAVIPGAHARLASSDPADGSLLAQGPDAVVLTFNRDIAPPASVVVTAPGGGRSGSGDPSVRGPVVSVPVTADLQGTYTVAYRVVSVDGHPITGSFAFSVGARSPMTPVAASRSPGGFGTWPWALGVGGLVGAGSWWRRSRRRRTGRASQVGNPEDSRDPGRGPTLAGADALGARTPRLDHGRAPGGPGTLGWIPVRVRPGNDRSTRTRKDER